MTNLAVDFGAYHTAADVRDAVRATIAMWSRTYLAEMARHDGQVTDNTGDNPPFPDFRSYPDSLDASRLPDDQLPSCVLVVPGLTRPPTKLASGDFEAEWAVGVGVVVGSTDRARTIRLCQLYTAAVRLILLQKPSLGDFASGVRLMGERFTDPEYRDNSRTMVGGMLQFGIAVDRLATIRRGPVEPIVDGATPTGFPTPAQVLVDDVTVYATTQEVS